MASGSRSPWDGILPRWIRPLHRLWKPLLWIWGALLFGLFTNTVSSWLIVKTLDLTGTPLGWLVDHSWITLSLLFVLILLTLLAWLASRQERAISPAPSLTLTADQRLQLIRGFEQEYSNQLASSLQGKVALELRLQERTDVVASSANLVFHQLETDEVSPLPTGTTVLQIYDRVQRGLLILGAPGSGKTTQLLQLAQALLQRAEKNPQRPIAIILNLSSWGSTRPPLAQWLGEQCSRIYGISKDFSAALIAQEQVQFLLDGLDEMEEDARPVCIEAINTYRQVHLVPLVVCSRSQEYASQPARLILPAAVEIRQHTSAQVSQVLRQAGKPLAAVRAALRSNPVLGEMLTTPLLLNVVILTYRDATAQELPQTGSQLEQQRAIFERYVQQMLKRYQKRRSFSDAQTMFSLVWLAQQMQQRHLTEFHLESLQANWLNTRRARIIYRQGGGLLVGLLSGLGGGLLGGLLVGLLGKVLNWLGVRLLLGLLGWLGIGLLFGLGIGLLFGLGGGQSDIESTEKLFWSWKNCGKGLLFGLGGGLSIGLFFRMGGELLDGLAFGLVSGLVGGLLNGLTGTTLTKDIHLKPGQRIHASGWNALYLGLIFFLTVGLLGGLGGGLFDGLFDGLIIGLGCGLFGGLLAWLLLGGAAYFQHYLLRLFLVQSRALPWRIVPFLEEARGCILLERVGGGYRFVHPLLQRYFTSLAVSLATEK